MTMPVIQVSPMLATSHVVRFNENINALSSAALYGIKASKTVGLRFTLYGGVYRSNAGLVFVVPEQYVDLTPSMTNYVYADSAGVILATTALTPTAGTLLYTLVVGANAITSGTCHVASRKTQGPRGAVGVQGPTGFDFWNQRNRWSEVVGQSAFFSGNSEPGFNNTTAIGSNGNINQASTSFYDSVAKMRLMERATNNLFYGLRGVNIGFRFGVDDNVSFTPADFRFFVGLYDVTAGTPSILTIGAGGVEPSTFLNIVGIGADSADSNASIYHNDGSGTATKVALGSSFPAKTAGMGGEGRIYELILNWEAGASEVTYSISVDTAAPLTGTLSTNLPSTTQALGWMHFAGGNSALVTTMYCQTMAYSRY